MSRETDPAEKAVSLNFKIYGQRPDLVFDFRTKKEYPRNDLDTKILVYEDRVLGWFLKYGKLLQEHHDAGFVVLQVALAQVEAIEQYRSGQSSENGSKKFFSAGLRRIFNLGAVSDVALGNFYGLVRCGLFHDGMTRKRVWIENRFPVALAFENDVIKISPNRFLDAVEADFKAYVAALKDPTQNTLRARFLKKWDGPAAETRTTAEILSGWQQDVKRLLFTEFALLAETDDTYEQVRAIARRLVERDKLPEKEGEHWVFFAWMERAYADSITVGIRRLLDRDPRNHSLLLLLSDMESYAHLLTRERFVAENTRDAYDGLMRAAGASAADKRFTELAGDAQAEHIPPELFAQQASRLRKAAGSVNQYVNEHIAHASRAPTGQPLGSLTVREALQEIFEILKVCLECITGDMGPTSPASAMKGNWTKVFRFAWLGPSDPIPSYTPLYGDWGEKTDFKKVRQRDKSLRGSKKKKASRG